MRPALYLRAEPRRERAPEPLRPESSARYAATAEMWPLTPVYPLSEPCYANHEVAAILRHPIFRVSGESRFEWRRSRVKKRLPARKKREPRRQQRARKAVRNRPRKNPPRSRN